MSDKVLFYPVIVSTHAPSDHRSSIFWGPAFDLPSQALAWGKHEIEQGNASMAFVVEFSKGKKTPMEDYIWPKLVKKAIQRWENLWDDTK